MIQHREEEKERMKLHEPEKVAVEAVKEGRRQSQLLSFAKEKHAAWRAKYRHEGSRWIPSNPIQ